MPMKTKKLMMMSVAASADADGYDLDDGIDDFDDSDQCC